MEDILKNEIYDRVVSSISNDAVTKFQEMSTDKTGNKLFQESAYITVTICKTRKIQITKALLPLKLSLFIYYGAGSFMTSFLMLLLKQRGISLPVLSTTITVAPIFQFLGTAASGIAADKLGRAKPVLVTNLLLVTSMAIGIVLLPKIKPNCNAKTVELSCHPETTIQMVAKDSCNIAGRIMNLTDCNVRCLETCETQTCNCTILEGTKTTTNFSLTVHVNDSVLQNPCYYDVNSIAYSNMTVPWCDIQATSNYSIYCTVDSGINCSHDTLLLITYAVLYIAYLTTASNAFRCMDVTTMCLAKEHDSDFGHERFFAILGNMLISPIAGLIANATTREGGERNYASTIWLFIGMNLLNFVLVYYIPVRVNPTSKNFCTKTGKLLKNVDVLLFFLELLILGTAWNFTKYFTFWYLEDMNAPSILLGLMTSVSALYGLPFLLTAKWWVRKIGTHQIFILAFLGYAVYTTGISFLKDPWYALVLEATGIFSYYLLWVAVVQHSHAIAPEGLVSTVIAVSGAVHFSVGKVSSGMIAGLMSQFGGQVAFRLMAAICVASAVSYTAYFLLRGKFSSKKNTISK